jgi:hypothetical protein
MKPDSLKFCAVWENCTTDAGRNPTALCVAQKVVVVCHRKQLKVHDQGKRVSSAHKQMFSEPARRTVSGSMPAIERHAFSKQQLNVLSQRQFHIVLGCLKTGRMNGEAQ